jgi:hypothetical protein
MDLLTQDEKNAYSQVFINIHDTFSRPIFVWKLPDRTIISTTQDYNFLYLEQPDIEQSFTPISGIFNARIKWNDPTISHDQKDIRETIRGNTCRIKVQADALAYISGAERVEIDGRPCNLINSSKVSQVHGLFTGDFYTLYLEESL